MIKDLDLKHIRYVFLNVTFKNEWWLDNSNLHIGNVIDLDRDIQAAENMLWCTQSVYYGFERPSYLTRP
jgi:hypothetical protein